MKKKKNTETKNWLVPSKLVTPYKKKMHNKNGREVDAFGMS